MEYYLGYFVIVISLIWIPTAFFTANVAGQKEYNAILWFIGGFIFGPLALIAVAGMPDRRTRKYLRRIAEKLDPENAKSSAKKYYLTRNKGNETLTTSE